MHRRRRRRAGFRWGWLLAVGLFIGGCFAVKRASVKGAPGLPETPPQAAPSPQDPRAVAVLLEFPLVTIQRAEPGHDSMRVLRRRLHYVRGGDLVSIRVPRRKPVATLVKQVGGVAGLNGTFFSDARVAGTGNKMIGPLLEGHTGGFVAPDPSDEPRCVGRPLVVWNHEQMAIVPYDTWMGESAQNLRLLVPGATDAFLGGGWLVRNGIARTEEEIRSECVQDAQDFRRRAFVGVDQEGRILLGATDFSVDSARLARAIEDLKVRDAILLDSGFSTSLVWRGQTLVSGHSRRDHPSRPVPHALVIVPPQAPSPGRAEAQS